MLEVSESSFSDAPEIKSVEQGLVQPCLVETAVGKLSLAQDGIRGLASLKTA